MTGHRSAEIALSRIETNEPRVLLAAPMISDQMFNIPEDSKIGDAAGVVVASDSDAGQILDYEIVAGNTNSPFQIDSLTGEITVLRPVAIDFERGSMFALTVRVTDDGMPTESAEATITINIDNVEEGELLAPYKPFDNNDQRFSLLVSLLSHTLATPAIFAVYRLRQPARFRSPTGQLHSLRRFQR